ncbi:MAG: NAD(P)/FAD-dependent oxidoreductase, partial [Rubellimicrobium sp.]|nr:NAD(P)/FAD-dependent oxidoreductase [Rubellimicrobium sp.]
LFHEDAIWRDLVAFTWNIRSIDGQAAIAATMEETFARAEPSGWRIVDGPEVEGEPDAAWLRFETALVSGFGRVVLQDGKAIRLMTMAEDIRGHEEPRGATRPRGTTHRADRDRQTWSEARDRRRARLGREDQPEVLIIGGGQGGLALGARLKALGVPALIVERNPRAGDSWRNRYRSLTLHDPVWYDHMPYLEFPETWPVFTPKDQMGDWLEAYALALDLDLWTGSQVLHARREGAGWAVTVRRGDGEEVTLTPRELVFATGAYGPPRAIDWPGAEAFQGALYHSSAHDDARRFAGKRAVVVGGGSSAHDVAVDLWEAGAEVTMVQRRPSIVVRSETLMELGFALYSEEAVRRGITVDWADRIGAALPYAAMAEGQRALYERIRLRDADYYARLAQAGYAFDFGEDETGLMLRALRTASGYYIDVGACSLIAEGQIAIASGAGVAEVLAQGLRLTDGRVLEADVIVACTGYQSMNEAVAGIVDRATADAVGPCWGLGSGVRGDPGPWQGELRNMWKPTAVEGLWFHGGNLALSRFNSRLLALQLKARSLGLPVVVEGRPASLDGSVEGASAAAQSGL